MGFATAVAAIAVALSLPDSARAAVVCDSAASPPYGGSYDAFNVPPPFGTYNVYYSYWLTFQTPYYARRREADGTIRYESLRTSGGSHDFANCTNNICTDVERRTQLQNSNGATGWSWEIQAWNTTSVGNC